jgi:hypothetical protein
MLLQAQDFVPSPLLVHLPIGPLLALTMLVLLASGLLVESGVLTMVRTWLTPATHKVPARIATAHPRS